MLDTSLPYIPVVMVCEDPHPMAGWTLPEGYTVRLWEPELSYAWCAVESAAGEFKTPEDAMTHFEKEFLPHPDELRKRMYLAFAPDGQPAGTVSLWFSDRLGKMMPRIHWVATHPDHEQKGIAKALLSLALTDVHEPVFLTTQTTSWPAVRLYKHLGFVPYEKRPVIWTGDWQPEEAWKLIDEKIKAFEAQK